MQLGAAPGTPAHHAKPARQPDASRPLLSARISPWLARYAALAAAAIFGAPLTNSAQAQSIPEATVVRLKYADYKDFQTGDQSRMHAKSPMLWVDSPITGSLEFEGSAVLDSLSGASPLYLDSLSGASGKGIDDRRKAADGKFTKYFENFSIAAAGAWSNEHDYRSRAAGIEARFWNDDKSRVFTAGVSNSWDNISSTNDPTLNQFRRTQGYLFGVTQIIDQLSVIQSNIGYTPGNGYFTDPYKVFDNRPRSRDEWAWLTRYVRYIKETEGSLHADYRLFTNSWGTLSHTITLSYYHPFLEKFIIRPEIRYYLQSKADFYNSTVPPSNTAAFNSADQRLAGFGSISAGLKLIYQAGKNLEFDALYDYIRQSNTYYPGIGDDHVRDLAAHYFEIGITRRF